MALPWWCRWARGPPTRLRERLLPRSRLEGRASTDPDAQYGPVVTAAAHKRVEDYIDLGATRAPNWWSTAAASRCQGHEKGFFVGPTLFDQVRPT